MQPDPMMDRIMDPDTYRPCRCTRGEACVRPAVPGDLFCAGCIVYCVPLALGRSPFLPDGTLPEPPLEAS